MTPVSIRLALVLAALAAGAFMPVRAAQANAELAPDVLVKNVTLEVVDLVSKDKDILAGDRAKTVALVEAKVLPHFNFARMTALAMSANEVRSKPWR